MKLFSAKSEVHSRRLPWRKSDPLESLQLPYWTGRIAVLLVDVWLRYFIASYISRIRHIHRYMKRIVPPHRPLIHLQM